VKLFASRELSSHAVGMNPKSISLLVVGLLAGSAGGYFLRGDSVAKAEQARVQTLEKEIATLKVAATKEKTAVSSPVAENGGAVAVAVTPENDAQSEKFKKQAEAQQERMKKAVNDRKSMKVAERLSTLKTRLGLTDAQAADLKKVLMENMKDPSDMLLAGMEQEGKDQNPKNELDLLLSMMKGGNDKELDAKVVALLSPEQQQAYAAFQAEQKANKVEIKANKELARLQNSMSLSPEQKDKAFGVFSQLATAEIENPVSPFATIAMMDPGNRMKGQPGYEQIQAEADRYKASQQNRLAAMKELLSPEQFQIYEAQSQQGNMAELMEGMMGDLPSEAFMLGSEATITTEAVPAEEVPPQK
jgi:hypothetical protein